MMNEKKLGGLRSFPSAQESTKVEKKKYGELEKLGIYVIPAKAGIQIKLNK